MKTLTNDEIEVIAKDNCPEWARNNYKKAMLKTRDEIEKRNRWIPVTERLPEKSNFYETTFAYRDGTRQIVMDRFTIGEGIFEGWSSEIQDLGKILAWREASEPFKD